MVSARSTSFLLIFILLPLRFSSADTQHQGENRLLVATRSKLETESSPVNVEQIYHGVPAFAETSQRTRFLPGSGRKMMSRGVLSKSNVVESENVAKGSTTKGGKMSGFIPLNADYYVPRPHPPKNN